MSNLTHSIKAGLLVVIVSSLSVGCASYSRTFQKIEQKLVERNPAAALEALEKQDHPDRNMLLYHMNKAMLLHMMRDYNGSNSEFESAKKLIEEFSASSVSEETAAFFVNDGTRTYTGSPVEQVMVHLYASLNYLALNQLDSARVEALQVDIRLRELAQNDPESMLGVDPFARYLSGMIYEELREWDDAMIAYRKAYQAYHEHGTTYGIGIPRQLKFDLLRLTRKNGLNNEHRKYLKEFGIKSREVAKKDPLRGKGELILLLHKDLAPIKRSNSAMMASLDGYMVRVSLPYYEERHSPISHAVLSTGKDRASTEVMEDINNIALQTLQSHMPAITARAIARAAVKKKMSEEAGNQNGLAGLLLNITGVLTEQADTRSWLTLPGEIQMARMPLPPGDYTLNIEIVDNSGQVVQTIPLNKVQIKKGRKQYLSYHWVSPYSTTRH